MLQYSAFFHMTNLDKAAVVARPSTHAAPRKVAMAAVVSVVSPPACVWRDRA